MAKVNKDETDVLNIPIDNYSAHVCDKPDAYSQTAQISGSFFDLAFKPTGTITYKSIFPQVLAAISAVSFHLPVGFVVAYSAILLPQLADDYRAEGSKLTSDEETWIASLSVLVVPFAALITGLLVDSIGRLCTLKIAAVPYIIGWICIACSSSLAHILVGRFLSGFSLAMGTSPAIAYITEVSRPDLRGTLICLGPAMTSLGIVLVYIAGWLLHWRMVAWMSIGVVIIPLLLMHFFSPESPTWLVSKGRSEDALKSLKIISQYRNQDQMQHRQLRDLEREREIKIIESQSGISRRFSHAIKRPCVYKPFFILSFCFFVQQFSGIYILIFYTINFFQDVKANINNNAVSVCVGLIRMFVGFITSQLLYKLGRRLLILSSFTAMAFCMFTSGFFTYLIHNGDYEDSWIRWIPIGCLLLYICVSTVGALSVPWTMTAEVYPIEIRGIMQGFTVGAAHLVMFIALKSYDLLRNFFGGSFGLQWFFGCVCIVGVFFCALFLPETHRKSLEEISDYFNCNTIYLRRKSLAERKLSQKNAVDTADGLLPQKV